MTPTSNRRRGPEVIRPRGTAEAPGAACRVPFFGITVWTLAAVAVVCLVVPLVLVVAVSFSASPVMSFPPRDFTLRWFQYLFRSADWLHAIRNSLLVAAATACLSTLVATPAALALGDRSRRNGVLRLLVYSPLFVSPIVIGISLLMLTSVLRGLYQTYWLVILAHSLWGVPLAMIAISAVLGGIDPMLPEAARDAGASAWQAFREVTLPLAKTGILIGWLFAFLGSFEEFVMALFLTTAKTVTLQVRIWNSLKYEVSPVVAAISSLEIALILAVTAAAAWVQGRSRRSSDRGGLGRLEGPENPDHGGLGL